jgi:hypothetical protein
LRAASFAQMSPPQRLTEVTVGTRFGETYFCTPYFIWIVWLF